MMMGARKALRWSIVATLFPIFFLVLALALHPYLSVTDPSGADVVVVEGWIPAALMPVVKEEIERRGYRKVYTTGTIRPFSYWLKEHGSITVDLPEPTQGGVRIMAAGLPGARFMLLADADTISTRQVSGDLGEYWFQLKNAAKRLHIQATGDGPEGVETIFIKEMAVRGRNAHEFHQRITTGGADGDTGMGTPTYAHHAAKWLREHNVVVDSIVAVPSDAMPGGRTAGNAEAFAKKAGIDEVIAFDVISMGVHARRSRRMYQRACGHDVKVGVISLPDPHAPPDRWWRERIGWIRLLKEMAGSTVAGLAGG